MNTLLKKSLITTAFVLMSSNAMAEPTAAGVFQWSGKVPEVQVNNGYCIAEVEGKTPHDSGVVTFHNKQGTNGSVTHDIQSSSELAFKVYNVSNGVCDSSKPAKTYEYALTDLKVGVNAKQMQPQDSTSNWHVMHAQTGTTMQHLKIGGQAAKNTNGSEVSLTLAGKELAVDAGDSVVAHAFVLVTDN